MPIRTKILAGCLALSLLTVLLGFVAEQAEQRLGAVALGIYDNAFMAVSYLRSAQINFAQLAAQSAQAPQDQADAAAKKVSRQAALQDILDDLDVVQERAMSPTGHSLATNLREQVTHVLPELGSDPVAEAAIGRGFERLVETFADDGFRYRRDVGRMVVQQEQQMVAAIAASLLVALAITALVTHLIAPPVRHAVRVAEAIAAGRLDTHIEVRGRGETGDLLRALSVMQASIAAGVARIQALIAEQAASHAGQMAARNAQLDAALGNMTQGLCMFDDSGRLVIANRRFGDMFKPPTPGQSLEDVLTGAGLSAVMDISRGGAVPAFACTIADGRSLSISQRPVAGGGWVATYDDVSERVAAEESLAHMARHDVLTGLGNRLMFAEHLQRMLVSPQTEGRAALLYLDLDRFKPVNDALGHPVGDALLRLVSERLLACVGGDDLVVRLGGDEFAVVQTSATQPTEASRLAQRIIDSLSEPYDIDDHLVLIGTSVGIALVQDNANADDLLKCADLALYRAKRDGRGIFRFFEPEMDTRMQVRRLLEHDLRLAVLREEMELYYQPLMHGKNGISGFEALLRWRHAERGIVSPTEFVPIAEELGLMPVLGRWVLRQACADAAAWPGDLKVAINLSPLQFTGLLVNDVQTALEMSGLPGNRLELEITESVLLQDDDAVLPTLHALRALGARIAMDDFGTGYSSLGYLQRFPFDKIKIDQSFVRNMTNRKDCLAIVRAVIGLGRSLGMSVNAEGVETQDQLAALLNEGCDELQGFLFSRPQPAVQVDEMLLQLGTWSNTPRLMAPTV